MKLPILFLSLALLGAGCAFAARQNTESTVEKPQEIPGVPGEKISPPRLPLGKEHSVTGALEKTPNGYLLQFGATGVVLEGPTAGLKAYAGKLITVKGIVAEDGNTIFVSAFIPGDAPAPWIPLTETPAADSVTTVTGQLQVVEDEYLLWRSNGYYELKGVKPGELAQYDGQLMTFTGAAEGKTFTVESYTVGE